MFPFRFTIWRWLTLDLPLHAWITVQESKGRRSYLSLLTKKVNLDVHVTVHRDKFLIIKPTRCTNFSNLFWNETLHVSDSSSVHRQEFSTVHTTMVYVIQVCWQLASRIRIALHAVPSWSCSKAVQSTVKNSWRWTEELSETCRVSFQE